MPEEKPEEKPEEEPEERSALYLISPGDASRFSEMAEGLAAWVVGLGLPEEEEREER